jgi:hypothetical protein
MLNWKLSACTMQALIQWVLSYCSLLVQIFLLNENWKVQVKLFSVTRFALVYSWFQWVICNLGVTVCSWFGRRWLPRSRLLERPGTMPQSHTATTPSLRTWSSLTWHNKKGRLVKFWVVHHNLHVYFGVSLTSSVDRYGVQVCKHMEE